MSIGSEFLFFYLSHGGVCLMLIPVIYPNGKHDLVKDFMLTDLIVSQGIVQFKRSNGWVNITTADIRTAKSFSLYSGEERRQVESLPAELLDIF